MNNGIIITNKELIKPKHRNEHIPYEYFKYEAIKNDSGSNVSIYEIPPQKSNYPYHFHQNSIEVFYIISGVGVLETPEGEKEIKAGDIIFCPAAENGAHKITNPSQTEMLVYLDCDMINYPDIVHYPHSDKIGVAKNNNDISFFKNGSNVNYYEGE